LQSINGRAYCLDIHTKAAVSSRRPASTDCDG
jgi:AhpD family alkylhydroperoxidase